MDFRLKNDVSGSVSPGTAENSRFVRAGLVGFIGVLWGKKWVPGVGKSIFQKLFRTGLGVLRGVF